VKNNTKKSLDYTVREDVENKGISQTMALENEHQLKGVQEGWRHA